MNVVILLVFVRMVEGGALFCVDRFSQHNKLPQLMYHKFGYCTRLSIGFCNQVLVFYGATFGAGVINSIQEKIMIHGRKPVLCGPVNRRNQIGSPVPAGFVVI